MDRAWDVVAAALLAAASVCVAPTGGHGALRAVVRVPTMPPFEPRAIRFDPPSAPASARLGSGGLLTVEARAKRPLTIRIPETCPVTVTPSDAVGPPPIEAKPWIQLGPDRTQVGFDARIDLEVVPGCAEADRGEVTWRQLEGPPLRDLAVDRRGFRLRARTLSFDALHPEPRVHGIVPISPRTQGRYVLEALWQGDGHAPVRRTVTITSTTRATGLPSLAVTGQVVLGGSGWHIEVAPSGGHAEVRVASGLPTFAPDAPGAWTLADADGRRLHIRASSYGDTLLDCGRAECHAAAAEAAGRSPMTHAFERQLATPGTGPAELTCMLDCHVVGERGLSDGGFLDTAASLGWSFGEHATWDALPRALRRLGGVRCMSCHGAGAVPPKEARGAILRSDVCATCHDAPPRYTHVTEWRSSRMATSDASPRTRAEPACARCHTTAGFLATLRVRDASGDPPDEEAMGIACAACHAPHGPHEGGKLVRTVHAPEPLVAASAVERDARSDVCVPCHSATHGESFPSASAASLWIGRASLPDGELVTVAGPHGMIPGGCLGCHGGARREGDAVKVDHSFRVDRAACASCHGADPPEEHADSLGRTVRARALALRAALLARGARLGLEEGAPLHAHTPRESRVEGRFGRALYEVALVLEDPAAGVHNARFARSLLEDAEGVLKGSR